MFFFKTTKYTLLLSLVLSLDMPSLVYATPNTPNNTENTTDIVTHFDTAVSLMKEKKYDASITEFKACLSNTTITETEKIACNWEIGWAYWMKSDWNSVVNHWTVVEQLDPSHAGLEEYLQQAKDNMALREVLQKNQQNIPATFASTAPAGATLRLRAVGDMMIGTNFPSGYLPPGGGWEVLEKVAPELQNADVTFGNLEGPVCGGNATSDKCGNSAPGKCYAFRSPPEYIAFYKQAGFDLLSTANNHANDFGASCRQETEKLLDEQGIAHSGRPGDIASIESNGLKISMIAFHTSRSGHYMHDYDVAKQLVQSQKATHDIVIVSFHGGAEGGDAIHVPYSAESFYGENRGNLREFSHLMIDAGADMVIGHGPHVLRGMEVYKDKLIAYSLGNFATYGRFSLSGNKGLGVILEATVDKNGKFIQGKLISTKQTGEGIPEIDPEQQAANLIRLLSTEDFPQTSIKIAQDGTIKP